MPQSINPNSVLIFILTISLFGLFTSLMIALNPPTFKENFLWRKPLIGLVFSLICVSGIFAVFFPKQCSEAFHFLSSEKNFAPHTVSATLKGHHPDCEKFSAHVIHIGSHTLCAACTGLLIGAFIALTGTVFYFCGGWHIEGMSFSAVLIGIVGIIFGFFQLKFRGFVRLMLNAFFVLGAFLILVGIDELTRSLFVDLFLVVLILFWLLTRILLSQWDHWRICHSCESRCEIRRLKKKG